MVYIGQAIGKLSSLDSDGEICKESSSLAGGGLAFALMFLARYIDILKQKPRLVCGGKKDG